MSSTEETDEEVLARLLLEAKENGCDLKRSLYFRRVLSKREHCMVRQYVRGCSSRTVREALAIAGLSKSGEKSNGDS